MQNSYTESARQSTHRLTKWKTSLAPIFVVATLLFTGAGLNAQIAGTANLQGTVTDATGAVVSKASIALTDEATQVKRTTASDASGIYVFTALPISTYDLTIKAAGFKTYEQKGIVLEVGSSISVNASLAVGSGEQTIEVQAEALALQTEDATFKQTIDHTEVNEMPLNGRRMTDLIGLSGGSNVAPAGDFTGSKFSYATVSVSIAGGGNDIIRPGGDPDTLAELFDAAVARLRAAGCRVLMFTGADLVGFPVMRLLRGRIAAYNMHLRSIADARGCDLVDLWSMRFLRELSAWSPDRLHLTATTR